MPAVAGPNRTDGWETPIGKHSAWEAAQRLFAGATGGDSWNGTLQHDKTLRRPGTSKTRSALPKGTTLSAPESLTLQSEGRSYTLLMWTGALPDDAADTSAGFAGQFTVLAVFPAGSNDATDVVEVKTDRETWLEPGPLLGKENSFRLMNAHHNSSQGYLITDLFHLRGGRMRRIASVFTLNNRAGCEDTFEEKLQWRIKSAGINPPRIMAAVDLVHTLPEDDDCEQTSKKPVQRFQDSYRWNPNRRSYVREAGNLNALDKWNEGHM
ncbi:MAG: hypothetical protein LBV29_06635 [Azoarcus sp.]|nr:hypothetical protein [Azoarcus sp.]